MTPRRLACIFSAALPLSATAQSPSLIFSPNADGTKDQVTFKFSMQENASVSSWRLDIREQGDLNGLILDRPLLREVIQHLLEAQELAELPPPVPDGDADEAPKCHQLQSGGLPSRPRPQEEGGHDRADQDAAGGREDDPGIRGQRDRQQTQGARGRRGTRRHDPRERAGGMEQRRHEERRDPEEGDGDAPSHGG